MCYSYEVSITTFMIGTVLTILNIFIFYGNPEYICITIYWFMGAILMQLWESLLWKDYRCELISKIAMINNVLQPILIMCMIFRSGYIKKNGINMKYVMICLGLYLCYMAPLVMKDYGCIKTKEGISLKWWNNSMGGIVYCITMLTLMKLIVSDRLVVSQQLLFVISLILGNSFYLYQNLSKMNWSFDMKSLLNIYSFKNYGYIGSIWCWVAAFAPVYNYVVFTYIV